MAEKMEGGLTEAEQAYFESEGETSFEAEAETTTPPPTPPVEGEKNTEEAQTEVAETEGKGEKDEKGRFVNYGALHAERTKRQQLEQEVGSLKQFKAQMEERWQWVEALNKQPAQEEESPPDPNVDVFAALKWTQDQLNALKTQNQETQQKTEQERQAQQQEQQVWTYWQQDAATYTKENPDFGNAAKWLSDFRDKQLSALSTFDQRFASPQQRNAQIEAELKDIVIRAAQSQRSPAQLVYELAKGYGYTKPAEDPGKMELPEKLRNVDKAQQGSRTVGQANGARSGGDEVSIDSLAAMPQNEFNEWMKVPANEARFKKMMGG